MSHDKLTIRTSIILDLRAYRDELEREASDPYLTDKERASAAQRAFVATSALEQGYISDDIIPEMLSQHSGLTEAQAANIVSKVRGAVDQMPFQAAG